MRRILILTGIMMIAALTGCGSAAEPEQKATTGISGTVKYTGSSTGGILIYASDQPPRQGEAPRPAAMKEITGVSGEFSWDLAPGTYYIVAFLTINRPPQGPSKPNEPAVHCEPVELKSGETRKIEVILTDADAGGKNKACVKKD